MVVLGILSTAALGGLEWRFRISFDPLLLLGAAAGFTALSGAVVSQVRLRSWRAPLAQKL